MRTVQRGHIRAAWNSILGLNLSGDLSLSMKVHLFIAFIEMGIHLDIIEFRAETFLICLAWLVFHFVSSNQQVRKECLEDEDTHSHALLHLPSP